jgi:ketosteroid isomerase-like protein
MARTPLPPLAALVSFVDCINRGDVDGLAALMTDDHRLQVLDEDPLVGRAANVEAWRGYCTSFPQYVIYPREMAADGARVTVRGTTTGSHLGLSDEQEMQLDVVWRADVVDGALALWQVAEAD